MKLLQITLIAIAFFCAQAAYAAEVVGTVSVLHSTANISSLADSIEKPLKAQQDIHLGDTIRTLSNSSYVKIDFIDGTNIILSGMDGTLSIDEYIFDPANLDGSAAKFSILKGSFEFVGGLLDKGKKENVQIDLDFGSIGVRGTKIYRTMKDMECWIYLEEGEIRVFNEGGSVVMQPGDGTRISSKSTAPTEAKPWSDSEIRWIKDIAEIPTWEGLDTKDFKNSPNYK